MIFKNKVRRRVAMVITAAALAIGGIVAGSVPAQAIAAETYDTFPSTAGVNFYYSTDSPSGAKGAGTIIWDNANGRISLQVSNFDTRADGHGPVMHVQVCFSDNYTNCVYHDFHNTDGNGSNGWDLWGTSYDNYVNDYSTVVIQECNGYSSSGALLSCSERKGPFHRY